MRWKFGNPKDKTWKTHRTEKLRRIDSWWKTFRKRTDDLDALFKGREKWDLPEWMRDNLQAVDERIMWEFGPGLKGGHRLVITPESDRHLRPLVETLLQRAPNLEGWEFYGYRLPEGLAEAEATLKARNLASISRTKVLVAPGSNNLLDLEFYAPGYAGPEDREALNSVFVATEVILGEQILDTWIGGISVAKETEAIKGLIALGELKETTDRQITAIKAKLPSKPAWQLPEDTEWTMWKLKPTKRDNYPGQEDMFVGKSMYADMWSAAHSDGIFCSERFSKIGELFCYVKTDGSVDLSDEEFQDKSEMEDALDAALKKSKSGAVIGGGTGLRYSYIDLALSDPGKGIDQVVNVLRKGKMVKRTWILFFGRRLQVRMGRHLE